MNARTLAVLICFSASAAAVVACSSSDTSSNPGGVGSGTQDHADGSAPQQGTDGGAPTGSDGGSQTGSDSGATGDSGNNHCPGCGDGGGPHDGGASDAAVADGGFGAACATNADCPAAYPDCFNYNAKGKHCTKQCTTAADCPAQSGGCSGMGVCKIP